MLNNFMKEAQSNQALNKEGEQESRIVQLEKELISVSNANKILNDQLSNAVMDKNNISLKLS
jgi:hypothetical protein